jgi:hypothetical protein
MNLEIDINSVKQILRLRGFNTDLHNINLVINELSLWSNDLVENIIDVATTSVVTKGKLRRGVN